MIGTSVRPELEERSLAMQPALLLVGIGATLLVVLSGVLIAVAAVISAVRPATTFNVTDGAVDVPLNTEISVALTGWDTYLEQATLYEAPIGADGNPGAEHSVPVQATLVRGSRLPEGAELSLRPTDGAFKADARYRLVAQASALTAAVPIPQPASYEREVRFTTLRSPTPQRLGGPVRLKWEQPLQIRWDAPIENVRYEVTPPTPIRTAIDPANRQLSSVVLEDPDDGQTYQIAVVEARGANGIPLSRPAQYSVIAPVRPTLQDADEPRTIEPGKPVTLRWNVPVDRVALELDPPAKSTWQVDRKDPTLVQVTLDELEQGTSYELKVAEAFSREGAPLREPPTLALDVPERLMVDSWTGTDGRRVSVKAKPTIVFALPIRDRKAAEAAFSVEPAVPGRWQWLDDQKVQFVPTRALPYDTELTFTIKPGPDGARAVNGSYFERPAILAFTTESNKLIDVDVTKQILTLFEEGRPVRTYKVGTGVPGADTPIGEFNVQYKMPKARFQGTNVSGVRYDIPDVLWVLAFLDDYTIHGVYWRSAFGVPASNGCVGLTDEDAKAVYDWAPEGTRIKIHY